MNHANNNKLAYLSVFNWKVKFQLTRPIVEKLNGHFPHVYKKIVFE